MTDPATISKSSRPVGIEAPVPDQVSPESVERKMVVPDVATAMDGEIQITSFDGCANVLVHDVPPFVVLKTPASALETRFPEASPIVPSRKLIP
jgi:hypothetical protein